MNKSTIMTTSYHFPIIVGDRQNERIVMVHLFDNTPNPRKYKESRVVFTQYTTPFFKVPKKFQLIPNDTIVNKPMPCILVPSKTERASTEEQTQKTDCGEKNATKDGVIIVRVIGEQKREDKIVKLTLRNESNENDNNYTLFNDRDIVAERIVKLTFICEIGEREYTGKLHMIYCPYNEISYTNIDLGSDVTQVSNYKGEKFPVTKELIKLFRDELNYTGESIYLSQYYDHNESFYRTGNILFSRDGVLAENYINYLSLNLDGINHYAKNTIGKKEKEIGKVVNTIDSSKYKTYPNIKVLYKKGEFRDVFPYKRKKNDERGVTMNANSFFNVMTEIYKKLIQLSTDSEDRFHSVLLLVPNIYSQLQVDELLYNMSRAMNKNLSVEDNATYFDFRAISESDAAFLGNKRHLRVKWTNDLRDDFFLMIDSGRGTTDYSIISRSSENTYTAVRRGGIVGAGGAIDYLFAYIYAKHLYKDWMMDQQKNKNENEASQEKNISMYDFQRLFMIWLSHLPSGPKEKIRLEIENLKIRFVYKGKNKSYTWWKKNFISEEAVKNIVSEDYEIDKDNKNPFSKDYSEEMLSIDEEDTALILHLCGIIADKMFSDIVNQDNDEAQYLDAVDYVIYTGRAFDFPLLRKAFRKKMLGNRWRVCQSLLANTHPIHLRPKHPKNSKNNTVCFASHNFDINLNSDICCLHDLMRNANLNVRKQRFFTKEMLFNGYTDSDGYTIFYLGYFGTNMVWSRAGINQHPTPADEALTIMTLYPNASFDNHAYDTTMSLLKGEDSIIEKATQKAKETIEKIKKGFDDNNIDSSDNTNKTE